MDNKAILKKLAEWARTFPGPIPTIAEIESALSGEIDAETQRGLLSYVGEKLWDRGEVKVEHACLYPGEWAAADFITMMQDHLKDLPKAYRDTAAVELCGGYEESTYLTIAYRRPQTDEEMAAAMGKALMHVMNHQERELAIYNRLSAKFAAPSRS